MNQHGNGNGKNGLFLKVLIGVCVALSASAIVGGIVLYGDVRELKKGNDLERRMEMIEALAASINADRHQRTVILQQLREDMADLKHRQDRIEERRR
jgi:hypothetical protein